MPAYSLALSFRGSVLRNAFNINHLRPRDTADSELRLTTTQIAGARRKETEDGCSSGHTPPRCCTSARYERVDFLTELSGETRTKRARARDLGLENKSRAA